MRWSHVTVKYNTNTFIYYFYSWICIGYAFSLRIQIQSVINIRYDFGLFDIYVLTQQKRTGTRIWSVNVYRNIFGLSPRKINDSFRFNYMAWRFNRNIWCTLFRFLSVAVPALVGFIVSDLILKLIRCNTYILILVFRFQRETNFWR